MASEAISAYIRIRPQTSVQSGTPPFRSSSSSIRLQGRNYDATAVFGQGGVPDNQETLYQVLEPVLQGSLRGMNVCIMAYGQTSAGKSHTIFGTEGNLGLVPRWAQRIFREEKSVIQVWFSMLELYQDTIRDLLAPDLDSVLHVIDHPILGATPINLSEPMIIDVDGVMELLDYGMKRCAAAETSLNPRSSRSHIIVTFRCVIDRKETALCHFVDLAGSEPTNIHPGKERQLESCRINDDLLQLGSIIEELQRKQRGGDKYNILSESKNVIEKKEDYNLHESWYNSILCLLLRNSLTGNFKTALVACIRPENRFTEETKNTLQFASYIRNITNTVHVNYKSYLLSSLRDEVQLWKIKMCTQLDIPFEIAETIRCTENIINKLTKPLQEQIEDAKREMELRDDLQNHIGLGHKYHFPFLYNLNANPVLSGSLTFPLKEGKTTIGSDESNCIKLMGCGVPPHACTIEIFERKTDRAYIIRLVNSHHGRLLCNGGIVKDKVKLSHGDRFIIGRGIALCLFFPLENRLWDRSKIQVEENDSSKYCNKVMSWAVRNETLASLMDKDAKFWLHAGKPSEIVERFELLRKATYIVQHANELVLELKLDYQFYVNLLLSDDPSLCIMKKPRDEKIVKLREDEPQEMYSPRNFLLVDEFMCIYNWLCDRHHSTYNALRICWTTKQKIDNSIADDQHVTRHHKQELLSQKIDDKTQQEKKIHRQTFGQMELQIKDFRINQDQFLNRLSQKAADATKQTLAKKAYVKAVGSPERLSRAGLAGHKKEPDRQEAPVSEWSKSLNSLMNPEKKKAVTIQERRSRSVSTEPIQEDVVSAFSCPEQGQMQPKYRPKRVKKRPPVPRFPRSEKTRIKPFTIHNTGISGYASSMSSSGKKLFGDTKEKRSTTSSRFGNSWSPTPLICDPKSRIAPDDILSAFEVIKKRNIEAKTLDNRKIDTESNQDFEQLAFVEMLKLHKDDLKRKEAHKRQVEMEKLQLQLTKKKLRERLDRTVADTEKERDERKIEMRQLKLEIQELQERYSKTKAARSRLEVEGVVKEEEVKSAENRVRVMESTLRDLSAESTKIQNAASKEIDHWKNLYMQRQIENDAAVEALRHLVIKKLNLTGSVQDNKSMETDENAGRTVYDRLSGTPTRSFSVPPPIQLSGGILTSSLPKPKASVSPPHISLGEDDIKNDADNLSQATDVDELSKSSNMAEKKSRQQPISPKAIASPKQHVIVLKPTRAIRKGKGSKGQDKSVIGKKSITPTETTVVKKSSLTPSKHYPSQEEPANNTKKSITPTETTVVKNSSLTPSKNLSQEEPANNTKNIDVSIQPPTESPFLKLLNLRNSLNSLDEKNDEKVLDILDTFSVAPSFSSTHPSRMGSPNPRGISPQRSVSYSPERKASYLLKSLSVSDLSSFLSKTDPIGLSQSFKNSGTDYNEYPSITHFKEMLHRVNEKRENNRENLMNIRENIRRKSEKIQSLSAALAKEENNFLRSAVEESVSTSRSKPKPLDRLLVNSGNVFQPCSDPNSIAHGMMRNANARMRQKCISQHLSPTPLPISTSGKNDALSTTSYSTRGQSFTTGPPVPQHNGLSENTFPLGRYTHPSKSSMGSSIRESQESKSDDDIDETWTTFLNKKEIVPITF